MIHVNSLARRRSYLGSIPTLLRVSECRLNIGSSFCSVVNIFVLLSDVVFVLVAATSVVVAAVVATNSEDEGEEKEETKDDPVTRIFRLHTDSFLEPGIHVPGSECIFFFIYTLAFE